MLTGALLSTTPTVKKSSRSKRIQTEKQGICSQFKRIFIYVGNSLAEKLPSHDVDHSIFMTEEDLLLRGIHKVFLVFM